MTTVGKAVSEATPQLDSVVKIKSRNVRTVDPSRSSQNATLQAELTLLPRKLRSRMKKSGWRKTVAIQGPQ